METVNGIILSPERMMIALVIGILFLILMILRTKIHTFLALILTCIFIGVIGGVPYNDIIKSITNGFGTTLGSIGIVIGLGVMMGAIFEATGSARTMANAFLRLLGKGKEDIALAVTGFVVSIPIFCDSGFVILAPLAKALSRATKKSIVTLGIALACGLVITHSLVPPTPGPVGVAGIFGVSVGTLMLWGIVIAIPMAIAAVLYARFIGKKIYQIPGGEGEDEWVRPDPSTVKEVHIEEENDPNLPGLFVSFAPILLPIVLILANNVLVLMGNEDPVSQFIIFLGQPIVAVAAGLIVAIFGLTQKMDRKETLKIMEIGIQDAGIIILVTGGGGALGRVMADTGLGSHIANLLAQTSVPAILLPFIIATLMRFIQGSGTVAMITSASITAPIIATLAVNPVFAALAACVGSLFFSYFNDSFFHVVTRTIGLNEPKEQIQTYSIASTILWATGIVTLLILNAFFG